jgi:peptide/nickel transport system ATP-binding protein
MSNPVLQVEDLKVTFVDDDGVNQAVRGVSLHVGAGEVLGIVGESGSGKTVTCATAMGLLHGWPGVVSGKLLLDTGDGRGQVDLLEGMAATLRTEEGRVPVKSKRAWRFFIKRQFRPRWGADMTMIFQNPQTALNPFWKVGRIVGEAVRQREPGLSRAEVRKKGLEWLERVRLSNPSHVWESHAHELSGGMAQRAMIAAALARGCRLIFADEPTTGLDTTVKARVVELFSELRRTENVAMVVISHDLGVVASLADRIVVMKEGQILETRAVEDVTRRAPDLHEYTRRLIGAVDVWKQDDAEEGANGD